MNIGGFALRTKCLVCFWTAIDWKPVSITQVRTAEPKVSERYLQSLAPGTYKLSNLCHGLVFYDEPQIAVEEIDDALFIDGFPRARSALHLTDDPKLQQWLLHPIQVEKTQAV